jgi:hypothetical protein
MLHVDGDTVGEQPRLPAGNRILTPRDLVEHFKGTEAWWTRRRPRMVKAGLLLKVGRKFAGDLSKIEAALADPAFWADEPEAAPAPAQGLEVAPCCDPA